jgi:hypothetical protein
VACHLVDAIPSKSNILKTRSSFRYSIDNNLGIEINNHLLRAQCISFIAVLSAASVRGYPDRRRLSMG